MPDSPLRAGQLSERVVPTPRVVFRRLGERSFLLELERGLYFSLDEVGTTIWQAFERRMTLQQTLDDLERHYAADRADLEGDLWTFVRESLEAGLIECGAGRGAS